MTQDFSVQSSLPAWVWFLLLGAVRWAVSGQAAGEGRGSSSLALLQPHYQSAHHWVRNGCRQDSNKYAPVRVDVIGVMKRGQPRERDAAGWGFRCQRTLSTAHPPWPKKQRTGMGWWWGEGLAFSVFLLKLCWMENLESSGSHQVKGI